MSSCQNDSGIIKYSVDSDQKKKSASTKRPDPKSSVQKVTTSSTPKEAASESEENQEPLVQKSDPPVQTIATEDELSHQQNVPNEAKSSTKPLTDKEKISKEATETKSRAKNVATCENQVDASKIEAPVTEVTDEETCPEPKTPSTPNENPISSPGSPNVGTESHEKEAAPMDVDQASSSKTESPSSAELEFTTMLTKVNLKSMILDCYSMLTKDEEARLAKKLPSVDCHKGSIRPDFFDDNNTIFWEAVHHWGMNPLVSSETDISTHSSRYDTIRTIMSKYSTERPENKRKRKMSVSVPEKKVARIRVNPPKPQTNDDPDHTEEAISVKRTGLRSQSKKKAAK